MRLSTGIGVGLALLGFGAASASGSTVQVSSGSLQIQGDPNDDALTVSTDGTNFTIVDTGTGGILDTDPDPADCNQVNPTTVTCLVNPGTPPAVTRYSVQLGNGVDSFVNTNFVTEFAQLGNPGDSGAKTLVGGPGSQSIFGGSDSDSLDGGEGDDFLLDGSGFGVGSATGGDDVLNGGAGEDSTQYFRQGSPPLSISLDGVANDGQAGEADNVQVEIVTAGNGDDTITGDASSNVLNGGGGGDLIRGLGGDDELFGDFPGGALLNRGIGGGGGDDTLDGGGGRDSLDCGRGFDLAIHDPTDQLGANCERTGAEVVGDSASVSGKKKNKFKVQILCPESEGAACSGKLKVTSSGKKVGKGKFSVANGKTKAGKAKLTKKGTKALKKAGGSLLVTVAALTTEPGGVTENRGRILVHD